MAGTAGAVVGALRAHEDIVIPNCDHHSPRGTRSHHHHPHIEAVQRYRVAQQLRQNRHDRQAEDEHGHKDSAQSAEDDVEETGSHAPSTVLGDDVLLAGERQRPGFQDPGNFFQKTEKDLFKSVDDFERQKSTSQDELGVPSVCSSTDWKNSNAPWNEKILSSTYFDAFIGFVIVSNSITIGLGQNFKLQGQDTSSLDALEHVYLVIYISELGLRFYTRGLKVAWDRWVQLDILLVATGVLTEWLLNIPMCDGKRCDVDGLGFIMVLRTARLFRLARTVRLLIKFRELWMLVRGLMDSASTMFYTFLLLSIILYIFSSIGVELITKHKSADPSNPEFDADFADHVNMLFDSVPQTMLTLLQFSTLDSVHAIYLPLVRTDPALIFYFLLLILVVSVVLMNLITAVVVNSALEQAMQDKELMKMNEEKQRKKLVKELRKIFVRLDEDGSGEVSLDEIANISDEDQKNLEQVMAVADPVEIFHVLDVDNSGSIGIDEFCEGIWQVASQKGNIDLKRIEKKVDSLRLRIEGHEYFHKDVKEALGGIKDACKVLQGSRPAVPMALTSKSGGEVAGHEEEDNASRKRSKVSSNSEPATEAAPAPTSKTDELTKGLNQEIQSLRAILTSSLHEALGSSIPSWASDLQTQMRELKGGLLAVLRGNIEEQPAVVFAPGTSGHTKKEFKQENDTLRFQLAAADDALLRVLQENESLRSAAPISDGAGSAPMAAPVRASLAMPPDFLKRVRDQRYQGDTAQQAPNSDCPSAGVPSDVPSAPTTWECIGLDPECGTSLQPKIPTSSRGLFLRRAATPETPTNPVGIGAHRL